MAIGASLDRFSVHANPWGGGGGGTRSGKGYRLWTECCGAVAVASKQC